MAVVKIVHKNEDNVIAVEGTDQDKLWELLLKARGVNKLSELEPQEWKTTINPERPLETLR